MGEQEVPEELHERDTPESNAPEPKIERRDNNTFFIGKKGTMGYVLAVVTQFNGGTNEVIIKARGKLISKLVDVVEIFRNRFMPTIKIKSMTTSTEELTSEDGSKSKVSAMEVILAK